MKDSILSLCKKILLAVKRYDEDEDDGEYDGITIVNHDFSNAVILTLRTIKDNLRREFPLARGEDRVKLLYRLLDELPLCCDECRTVQVTMHSSSVETVVQMIRGITETSTWTHVDGDYPSGHDDIMDTDYRDREVDEYNVECRECGNAYDTDSWTIAIPRDLAEEIIDAAQVISGKKRCSAKVATPKSRTILTQFSETKNRSELCLQEYDDNDAQGVGYPIHESMEKLL